MWMRQDQKSRAGAELANGSQPMRRRGLWSQPMGERVGDSVLRTKVRRREFDSAIALVSYLLHCDPSSSNTVGHL